MLYPTVLHEVLHKPTPGTPIKPLHPPIFHNNIHKAGSIRNRQVIGSSPIVGSSNFFCFATCPPWLVGVVFNCGGFCGDSHITLRLLR